MVEIKQGLGWRPDVPDFRDLNFDDNAFFEVRMKSEGPTLGSKSKLPDLYIIPETKLPKVFDQGRLSSCVGNATSSMVSFVRKIVPRSRLFIYYEARRMIGETAVDAGCYIRDAIKVLANLGAPREDLWPYREEKVFVDPPINADLSAKQFKIVKYARLNTPEDYRRCLAEGFPFVIGFATYTLFNSPDSDASKYGILLLPEYWEDMLGGHAVLVYGYNDNFRESAWAKELIAAGYSADKIPNRVYYIRNSWGKDWGRYGNFVIAAEYLENPNLSADAWTIRKS